jgi:single-strand DNA-binding protein
LEVTGRIYVSAYVGTDGTAKASLNCHVSTIKIHAWPKEVEMMGTTAPSATEADSDDVPF